ncbi:hypothetical protein LIA77_04404 [Sarocladium implicatum]|nr:hypothetical protein LIA77_04404 [Sarocladium implicatum]
MLRLLSSSAKPAAPHLRHSILQQHVSVFSSASEAWEWLCFSGFGSDSRVSANQGAPSAWLPAPKPGAPFSSTVSGSDRLVTCSRHTGHLKGSITVGSPPSLPPKRVTPFSQFPPQSTHALHRPPGLPPLHSRRGTLTHSRPLLPCTSLFAPNKQTASNTESYSLSNVRIIPRIPFHPLTPRPVRVVHLDLLFSASHLHPDIAGCSFRHEGTSRRDCQTQDASYRLPTSIDASNGGFVACDTPSPNTPPRWRRRSGGAQPFHCRPLDINPRAIGRLIAPVFLPLPYNPNSC